MPTPVPGPDENTPLAKYEGADPFKETLEAMKASGYKTYGPLKALSEQETEKWFPGKSLIIRPGLIVGPRDETDRFTYWPVRIDRGGEVVAPGNPSDPVQFIDGRDLAEWTVRMAENRETGIYNATGPAKELGIGGMLDGIKTALNSNATFAWADAEFLKQQKVEAWSDMPVWAGDELGMSRTNISRALAKGLTFRSLGRYRARCAGVVQSAEAGTAGQNAGRTYAGARSRSSGRLAQTSRRDEARMTFDTVRAFGES